jgi:uncharacterized protein YybS (DUF2232 family)
MNQDDRFGRAKATASFVFAILILMTLIPLIPLITIWFFPIPLAVLYTTSKRTLVIALTSFLTAVLVSGGLGWTGILLGVATYFVAWVNGECLRRMDSPYGALITSTLVFIMLELVALALMRYTGVNLDEAIKQFAQYEAHFLGASDSLANQMAAQIANQVHISLPAYLSIWAFLVAAVNFIGTRMILGRALPQRPLLSSWRLPLWISMVFVTTTLIINVKILRMGPVLSQIFESASLMTGFLLFIQGLAVLWRRLKRSGRGRGYVISLGVLGLLPYVPYVYLLLGLIDTLRMDDRK